MNIFYISPDPRECAQALDQLRLNKMQIETAQLISNGLRANGCRGLHLYRSTHVHHPCTLWAAKNVRHMSWLIQYLHELYMEWGWRTPERSTHRSGEMADWFYVDLLTTEIPLLPWEDPPNVTPFPQMPVIEAYKQTLRNKWATGKRRPNWKKRGAPSWRIL